MNSYTWRAAIIRSELGPTTRHVLLTLSCHINDAGEPTYPSTLLLSDECGLSERAVITHLKLAASLGWLMVSKHGYAGQGWARNQYRPRTPDGFVPRPAPVRKGTEAGSAPSEEKLSTEALNDVQYVDGEGTEGRSAPLGEALNVTTEGTEPDDKKALKDVQSNYPQELPKELPKTARAKRKAVDKAFEQLWAVYPRKVSREAALKAYRKVDPDEALQAAMLAAVVAQSASHAWTKDGGTFIPHASTWLNGARWTDEVPDDAPAADGVSGAGTEEPWYRRWSGITAKGVDVFRAFREGEDPLRYKVAVFKRAGEGKWRDELMTELLRTKNSLYPDIHQYIYGHPPVEVQA